MTLTDQSQPSMKQDDQLELSMTLTDQSELGMRLTDQSELSSRLTDQSQTPDPAHCGRGEHGERDGWSQASPGAAGAGAAS